MSSPFIISSTSLFIRILIFPIYFLGLKYSLLSSFRSFLVFSIPFLSKPALLPCILPQVLLQLCIFVPSDSQFFKSFFQLSFLHQTRHNAPTTKVSITALLSPAHPPDQQPAESSTSLIVVSTVFLLDPRYCSLAITCPTVVLEGKKNDSHRSLWGFHI